MKKFFVLAVMVVVCLVVAVQTTQAQITNIGERDPFWGTDNRWDMPVTLCHIPPGNPANAHTIEVAQAAVPAHLAHGDLLGACPYECDASPVPATGQTECWDQDGIPIDCSGTGQDGEYQMGVPSPGPRFTDKGDGTVTDNLTGLIWLQNANCFFRRWDDALLAASNLADGSCGLTDGSVAGDWRLPNIKELQSLVDFGQSFPALPPDHPFSDVQDFIYWSSTSYAPSRSNAWILVVHIGAESPNAKSGHAYVWPVRGGQWRQ